MADPEKYTVGYKHDLVYIEQGKEIPHGSVISLSDSEGAGLLQRLVFASFVTIQDVMEIYDVVRSFILCVDDSKEANKLAVKVAGFLDKSPHKAAVIDAIDKNHNKALLTNLTALELKKMPYKKGFLCKVIRRKQAGSVMPTIQRASSTESYVQSSTASTPLGPHTTTITTSSSKRDASQQQAEAHYNELKRSRSTRHLSRIFHLRNLNNFVKAEVINTAGQMYLIQQRQLQKTGGGLRVLDLACGKGGDIFKWFRNPAGVHAYVGSDIAQESLKDFVGERLAERSIDERHKVKKVVCADLSQESLTQSPLNTFTYDTIGKRGSAQSATE